MKLTRARPAAVVGVAQGDCAESEVVQIRWLLGQSKVLSDHASAEPVLGTFDAVQEHTEADRILRQDIAHTAQMQAGVCLLGERPGDEREVDANGVSRQLQLNRHRLGVPGDRVIAGVGHAQVDGGRQGC